MSHTPSQSGGRRAKNTVMEPKGVDSGFWLNSPVIFNNPGHFFCLHFHFYSTGSFQMTRSQSISREKDTAFFLFTRKISVNDFKKSIIRASRVQVGPEGERVQTIEQTALLSRNCSCWSHLLWPVSKQSKGPGSWQQPTQ